MKRKKNLPFSNCQCHIRVDVKVSDKYLIESLTLIVMCDVKFSAKT